MRKVTPTLAAKIRNARARGATIASIARKYSVSVGSVSGVVNAPDPELAAPSTVPAPSPVSIEPAPATPPTHDDIRSWLGEQVAALRADCGRYRTAGNASALAAATRNLHSATALLERVTPAPANESGTFVTNESMAAEADKFKTLLRGTIRGLVIWRDTWPTCHACGGHIAPQDFEQQLDEHDASEATRDFAQLLKRKE